MTTTAQVTKRYNKLLHDVKTKEYYTKIDLTNRVNCYVCKNLLCRHITKTKDVDAGVTPFMFTCEKCSGEAHSTFYRDIVPNLNPTWEWYRPSLDECLKMKNKRPGLLDHILQGGLDARKINPPVMVT